jgi:antitoxin component YwqK of YwqJK toxin-antitoxin module
MEIESSQLTMTEDYVYLYQGQPFTGLAYETYQGRRLSETHYEQGFKQGLARRWYPGTELLYYELAYVQNVLHGTNRKWYENGQLKIESQEEQGVTLWRKTWDQQGELIEDYGAS